MRLITEYMSVPEVNGVVVTEKLLAKNTPEVGVKQPELENTDNRNLQLAKEVEAHRSKLTNALVKFPVAALWVLSKYDQSVAGEEDEDSSQTSECLELFAELRKHYLTVSQAAQDQGKAESDQASAAAMLACALKRFPFTFEDLVKLVDIIIYAYKYRGLSFNPDSFSNKKAADVILKRLEGAARRGKPSLAEQFKAMDLHAQESQFLFLSVGEMGKLMPDVVLAEHHWLKYRQQLASANAKLVLFIANQYKGNFLEFDDLVQEGHTGLLKAVDRFKYRLGFQFSTYAGYWIRQAISRALSRSERVVRIPCGQIATINKLYRSKDEFILKHGKKPTVRELADYCQLSEDEVNNIFNISQTAVALESFDEDDDEAAFAPIDFLEQKVFSHCFNQIAQGQLESLVRTAVKTLNGREAKILCSHFGVHSDQQKTLQEIGDELNLTRERVRQIQVVALNKIKTRYGEQLASFM